MSDDSKRGAQPESDPLADVDTWIASCLEEYHVKSDIASVVKMNQCLSRQIELGKIMERFYDDMKKFKRVFSELRSAIGAMEDRTQRAVALAKAVETDNKENCDRIAKLEESLKKTQDWIKEKLGPKKD